MDHSRTRLGIHFISNQIHRQLPSLQCTIYNGNALSCVQGDVHILDMAVPSRLLGDLISICGALGGVLTLVAGKCRRGKLELHLFTTIMVASAIPIFMAASFLWDTPPPRLSFSPVNGAHQKKGKKKASSTFLSPYLPLSSGILFSYTQALAL
jgi:hypothetical protein